MDQTVKNIPIEKCRLGSNDRTRFAEAELRALAENIRVNGLIQPVTVRPTRDGHYEIVTGERRYRACRILGWETIPAVVKELTDAEAAAFMLAENVARENLDPIDEARAYARRMEQYGLSVEEVAEQAGVSRIRVQFRLKLLSLTPELTHLVRVGDLPLGYAEILANAELDSNRQTLALRIYMANPSPTPTWFRRECGRLREEQLQEPMFLGWKVQVVETVRVKAAEELPTPTTHTAPVRGNNVRDLITGQVAFWREAASAWDALGKPFKRQECEAAAVALENLREAI